MLNYIITHWCKILPRQTGCTCYISSFTICVSHWWNWRHTSFVRRLPSCSRLSHKTSISFRRSWNWIALAIKNSIHCLWIFNASSMRLVQYFVKCMLIIPLFALAIRILCWSIHCIWFIFFLIIWRELTSCSFGSFYSFVLWSLCFLITILLLSFHI